MATAYSRTLSAFYQRFLNNVPLGLCIANECLQTAGSAPFTTTGASQPLSTPNYLGQTITIQGTPGYPGGGSDYDLRIDYASPIWVVGHSGLRRYDYDQTQDGYYHCPADHP